MRIRIVKIIIIVIKIKTKKLIIIIRRRRILYRRQMIVTAIRSFAPFLERILSSTIARLTAERRCTVIST